MSNEWTAFDFKRQLVDQVSAVLSVDPPEVRLLTYFPSPEEPLTDAIILGHSINDDLEAVALGNQRFDEAVNLECQVRVVRPGAGEEPAREAEDRAALLLSLVDTQLRTDPPSVGNQTLRAEVDSRDAALFAWQSGDGVAVRACIVDFVVSYRARTSRS
jgi:hypothetical protein